jgi:tetratricopeptide (TPR) repeat protein
VGPAHFDVRLPQYRTERLQTRPVWVHNEYLNTLTDYGVVGAVLIVAFLGLAAWGLKRTWRYVHRAENSLTLKRSDRAAHVLGVGTGLVALGIHSITDFHLHVPGVALTAVALLASLTGHLRFATARCWISPRLPGRLAVTVLGIASLAYLAPQALRAFREGRALTEASRATAAPDQLRALQTAWLVESGNWETAQRLGEYCRLLSWQGPEDWRRIAEDAIGWFQRACELNRWESAPRIRLGMCLDWLGRHDEATPWFQEALRLDPLSYYTHLMLGWHELQRGDYARAREHLEQSLKLKSWENFLANNYLKVVNERLQPSGTSP